jgi:hypothetical protein
MSEYTQRELVQVLVGLIDAAGAKGASAHRDIARSRLRQVMRDEHWNTSFVLNNIARKRCRYLAGLGYPVPTRWAWKPHGFEQKVEDE